jgi:hypothetical protein
MRRADLPIMIGKGLRKGICAGRSGQFNDGVDLYIVWLKNKIESGARFTWDDVYKVNAILHFCDKDSVKRTIDVLVDVLAKWGEWNA